MPFLPPNQQRQSTEGTEDLPNQAKKSKNVIYYTQSKQAV